MDSAKRSRLIEISEQLRQLAQSTSPDQVMGGVDPDFLKGLATLHQIKDPLEVAGLAAKLAVRFASGERAFVMLLSEDNRLRFAAGENVTAAQLSSGVPVARQVIQSALQSSEIIAEEFEGRSVVGVPILHFPTRKEESLEKLGLLYLDAGSNQAAFSDPVLELLEAIVDHTATALAQLRRAAGEIDEEQVRELEAKVSEAAELRDRLNKITEIGREISSTLDMDTLFTKICDYVIEVSGAQRGFIMLIEDGEPEYKIGRNFRRMTIPLDSFQFSRSITHKVITERKPQVIVTSSDEDFDPSRSMVAMALKSVMCIPLLEKDNVMGLVYLDSQQATREFSDEDAEFLQSLCGQAAVALLNARLLKDATDRERVRSELDLAASIQLGLLPKTDPDVDGLEIRGRMIPAKEVGGDYFDFIPHVNTKKSVTVAIGDVSGKGVGAGLVMIMARSIIRAAVFQAGVPRSPAEIMRNLNTIFCQDLRKGMFMTLNIVNWWAETNTISYCASGHEHVVIYRAQSSTVEHFKAGGVATGVLTAANNMYMDRNIPMNEGDVLLLYTDGVTEAMNEQHEEWSLEALLETVRKNGDKTPLDLINAIYTEIRHFVGRADQHDDITMVAMKAKPKLFTGDMSSEVEDLLGVFGE